MKEITLEIYKIAFTHNGLTRTSWKGTGWIEKKEYTLLCSAETEKRGRNGTAYVVLNNVRSSKRTFESINKRKSRLRFKECFYN
jgi:hypothetical protein